MRPYQNNSWLSVGLERGKRTHGRLALADQLGEHSERSTSEGYLELAYPTRYTEGANSPSKTLTGSITI